MTKEEAKQEVKPSRPGPRRVTFDLSHVKKEEATKIKLPSQQQQQQQKQHPQQRAPQARKQAPEVEQQAPQMKIQALQPKQTKQQRSSAANQQRPPAELQGPPPLKQHAPPSRQQAVRRPSPGAPPRRPRKKLEKNSKFQDLENTGRWGSISKMEMVLVGFVLLGIAGGIVTAVALVFSGDKDDAFSGNSLRPVSPTFAPTFPPQVDPNLQLPVILKALKGSSFLNATVWQLPNDIDFYREKDQDNSQIPLVRAISWSLYKDLRESPPTSPWLVPRCILASIYYSLSGERWDSQGGWLTYADACDWNGVFCDRFGEYVNEIDLTNNNLEGSIPLEFSMFPDMIGLILSNNKLTGTIPYEALGSLPSLSFLFLNDNRLTGTISTNVRKNGVLSNLMLQQNQLTGSWPGAFCNANVFKKFGIDCDEVRCNCCNKGDSCF